VEEIVKADPAIERVLTVPGYSILDGAIEPNAAFVLGRLKPFEERTTPDLKVDAVIQRVAALSAGIPSARVIPFNLPPIIGLGTSGGFEYQLNDLQGRKPEELAAAMRALVLAGNQDPALKRVFSTWATDNPQVYLDIDRGKAQTLGIKISDLFTALQATLGGYYVNDFNKFGRVWQVQVQGEASDRERFDDVYRIHVRNDEGEMVPVRAIMAPELRLGPQLLQRYNNYRSVTVQGGPAPGRSSGDALKAMEEISAKTLPAGYGFDWTGTAFQEKEAGGKTPIVLGFAVLFAYLFLVGLYYPGSRAAGYCFGRGRGQSEGRGDRGVRRNAGGVHSRSVPDPDALCGVPTAAGVVSRLSGPSKIRAGSNCRFGRITPECQIESVSLCSQRCLTSPCSIIRPASASAIPAWIASICQKLSFRNSSIARSARYDLERSVAMAHASSAALASSDIRRVMVDMG